MTLHFFLNPTESHVTEKQFLSTGENDNKAIAFTSGYGLNLQTRCRPVNGFGWATRARPSHVRTQMIAAGGEAPQPL